MNHRFAAVLVAGFCASTGAAQSPERKKIDFHLQHFLQQEHTAGEEVNLFIHGPEGPVAEAVRAQGGLVKRTRPGLVSARVRCV